MKKNNRHTDFIELKMPEDIEVVSFKSLLIKRRSIRSFISRPIVLDHLSYMVSIWVKRRWG